MAAVTNELARTIVVPVKDRTLEREPENQSSRAIDHESIACISDLVTGSDLHLELKEPKRTAYDKDLGE